ncbi:MAG: hypothetical protein HYY15_01195 [Candidatus Omnitrophica bacterium]|nr:hypothetical protein [Candidatus Omnitrophota bacterium]
MSRNEWGFIAFVSSVVLLVLYALSDRVRLPWLETLFSRERLINAVLFLVLLHLLIRFLEPSWRLF